MQRYATGSRKQTPLDDLSDLAITLLAICRRFQFVGVRPGSPLGNAAAELVRAGYIRLSERCACGGLVGAEVRR
jgi:hypothetical protein